MSEEGVDIRRYLRSNAWVIALGLVLGATSSFESWAPLVALGAVVLLWISFLKPAVPVALAFCGILLDARGMMGSTVLGVPLSLSKILVLYAIVAHLANALVTGKPLFRWMPTTAAMFLILLSSLASLLTSVAPAMGYIDVAGLLMLTVMCHLVYTALPKEDLPWVLRFMAFVTVAVLIWTLLTQRIDTLIMTLDAAWQQRTSGAYGDPNAWSTSLVVICPILLAWLVKDDHWSATPLLFLLGITFPAAILQSMSRAGLISFVAIAGPLLYMARERKGVILLAIGAIIMILPFVLNIESVLLRYRTLMDPTLEADLGHGSLRERTALLEAGIHIFLTHPVLGVGIGAFRLHASYVSAGEVWKIAHNSYLNVAAEQGIVGLLTHGYLYWRLFQAAWNTWNKPDDDLMRTIGLGFMLSFAAYSLMALTLNLATFAAAWYMLGIGLVIGRYGGAEETTDRMERLARTPLRPVDGLAEVS